PTAAAWTRPMRPAPRSASLMLMPSSLAPVLRRRMAACENRIYIPKSGKTDRVKGAPMPIEEIVAPKSLADFQEKLRRVGGSLPKRLKQCADHIAANPDKIAFSTVADLAAGAQVPASALMRFCQEMGFSGYSQMQRLYREDYSQKWPDYSTRLSSLRNAGGETPTALLAEFAEAGRASIENLTRSIDPDALRRAVTAL